MPRPRHPCKPRRADQLEPAPGALEVDLSAAERAELVEAVNAEGL